MRNDPQMYERVPDRSWSNDLRFAQTLNNLEPGRMPWFACQGDWQGPVVLDTRQAGPAQDQSPSIPEKVPSAPDHEPVYGHSPQT